MNYTTPGVYVNETPLTSLTSASSGQAAAVFLGEALQGPTTPQLVSNWTSYKSLFGEITTKYDLPYAVYHYFANGGKQAYVIRVASATAQNAQLQNPERDLDADGNPVAPPWEPGDIASGDNYFEFFPKGMPEDTDPDDPNADPDADVTTGASAVPFTVSARSAGSWGNGLTLFLTEGNLEATSTSRATFNLAVALNGKEVERWNDLSLDPGSNRYIDSIVNNYSSFIVVSEVSEVEADANETFPALQTLTLQYGADYGTADDGEGNEVPVNVNAADFNDALRQMDGVKGNLLINAVGKTDTQIVGNTVSYAAERGDSFVIIDPERTDTSVSDIQQTASRFTAIAGTGYASHYAPMLKMVDPARTGPGAIRTTFPGGAIAGVIIRTETERNIAKAPAGISAGIRGAIAMEVKISEAELGTLYSGKPHVNSFKVIPGAGLNIYGARTLARTTPDKYIPVRRTLNYVKSSLKDMTEFAVFEPNGPRLWEHISARCSSFLAEMWRQGSLAGSSTSQAFYVVCNDTNNTQVTIDQGIVNVDVGVALAYPAEFIVVNISQWTGGANAAESF
jgi:phage tail sheath protein FI